MRASSSTHRVHGCMQSSAPTALLGVNFSSDSDRGNQCSKRAWLNLFQFSAPMPITG